MAMGHREEYPEKQTVMYTHKTSTPSHPLWRQSNPENVVKIILKDVSSLESSSVQSLKLTMKLAFFGQEHSQDDVRAVARHLLVHSKSDHHRCLHTFLHAATVAVKDEIRALPHAIQALVPSFEHVLDLVNHAQVLQDGPLAEPVERVLLCVLKLGAMIGYYELSPATYDFNRADACFLGLGAGLLVAAAVSLSPAIGDLPARSVEVVRVTFRCAFCVDRIARTLDTFDPNLTSKNWIYLLFNESEQRVRDELEVAQLSHNTPSTGKIFVCNARPRGISVSGPPSRIQRLFEEVPFFRKSNFIRMPCYGGPLHADHVFDEEHVSSIVKPSQSPYPPQVQIISPSTGQPFTATDATELFKQVVRDLLTKEVRWEKAVSYVAESVKGHGGNFHQIYALRTAQQVQDLIVAINAAPEKPTVSTVDMMAWLFTLPEPHVKSSGSLQSKIAIVGMSCRFPGGANDTDQYWDLLESGRDVHEKVPADRFDIETHFDPTGQKINATHTPYGCFVENPGLFDPAFFNMSPREAEQTDPMQRLALVTAYEALEKAGFVTHKSVDMHRIGTFFGQSSDDYREVNSAQDIGTYWISGGCRAFGPGRINYFCGFSGPSFNCDTACSSSLATIQMACTSLWSGDTDMVVAGGMNILTNPDGFAGLSKGFFLSNTGNCKTWDSEADGYCRADGVGAVVMKRLEDALADNDNILGVVGAAATNHSAEAISITHPHSGAQSHLFRQVINRAGVDPLDVGYVELHGTGTQAGDSKELESVTDVFAPATQGRNAKQPLFIGAAKANVGHGEAAAGIMSLVKTLCVLQKESIPPHVGVKKNLTSHFPADAVERNLHIPYNTTPWRRSPERKRIAIVNNFGAAGGNTTFVLEEGPEQQIEGTDPRSTHVLTLSAKNIVSLQRNIERLLSYLEKNPGVALHDLAYTLTARRAQYTYRVSFAISEFTNLRKLCEPYLAIDPSIKAVRTHQPLVAFAFTGQGSFYSPMASQLFKDSPPFRTHILNFDRLVRRQGFKSFLQVIDGSAPSGHKFSLVNSHLAIVCVEMALCNFWEDLGVKPGIVIGHSIGEVSALYAARVLSASDAIFLVGQRARILERLTEAGAYGMLAVRASTETLKEIAGAIGCDIACINGPEDTVLAGRTEALSTIAERLRADGHKTFPLELSHGYHSQQMDSIADEYESVAQGVVFHKPSLPIISPLLSRVVEDKDTFNALYMRRSTREAVKFMDALRAAQQSKAINEKTVWIELGPHPLCISFVRNSIEKVGLSLPSLRKNEENWATLSQTLCQLHCAGIKIDWREYHRPFEGALKLLDLPTYAWNNKNLWIPYSGDWALNKGNQHLAPPEEIEDPTPKLAPELQTSSIHGLVEETYDERSAKLVVETNILDPNILDAVNGHAMNGYGVVSCMVHGEIAYTMAKYLYKKLRGDPTNVNLTLQNFEYHEPLVARKSTDRKQMMHTEGILPSDSNTASFRWYDVESDNWYSCATITFENADAWMADWSRSTHLITSRIEYLQEAAENGRASKLSRHLAYRLFANLVDWSEVYQGMQTVFLDRMEAYAEVQLSTKDTGEWYIPPWRMESLVALSAFILNCSDVTDNKNNFFITPGYKTMRFAKPLKPGGRYQSYVKMMPMGTPNMYAGDVYILEAGTVVGVMEKIMFRSWPWVMLQRFFVSPDKKALASKPKSGVQSVDKKAPITNGAVAHATRGAISAPNSHQQRGASTETMINGTPTPPAVNDLNPITNGHHHEPTKVQHEKNVPILSSHQKNGIKLTPPPSPPEKAAKEEAATTAKAGMAPINKKNSLVIRALAIIADEAAIDIEDLDEETTFADLGIDSLMSLVLAQKFRSEISVEVRDSIFIEFPYVRDLCRWLETC